MAQSIDKYLLIEKVPFAGQGCQGINLNRLLNNKR